MAENKNYNKKDSESKNSGKVKKYFFKTASELGFDKRNYFVPEINKKVVVVAGEETTEEVFKILDGKAKEVFLTQKEVDEIEKAKIEKE